MTIISNTLVSHYKAVPARVGVTWCKSNLWPMIDLAYIVDNGADLTYQAHL